MSQPESALISAQIVGQPSLLFNPTSTKGQGASELLQFLRL